MSRFAINKVTPSGSTVDLTRFAHFFTVKQISTPHYRNDNNRCLIEKQCLDTISMRRPSFPQTKVFENGSISEAIHAFKALNLLLPSLSKKKTQTSWHHHHYCCVVFAMPFGFGWTQSKSFPLLPLRDRLRGRPKKGTIFGIHTPASKMNGARHSRKNFFFSPFSTGWRGCSLKWHRRTNYEGKLGEKFFHFLDEIRNRTSGRGIEMLIKCKRYLQFFPFSRG